MVSRAVGAAALVLLAVVSASAQNPVPVLPGGAMPGGMMPGGAMPGGAMPGETFAPVPTSVDPMLRTDVSTFEPSSGSRFWFDGGYQAGYIRKLPTPATIATQGGAFAVQGAPGTSVALGGGEADLGVMHGGRFTGGFWLDNNRAFGVELSASFLSEGNESRGVAGGGVALSRPFFDTSIQAQNARLLNLPGQVSGSVSSTVESLFWGADLGPVVRVIETSMLTLDQLFFFRYSQLEESQTIIDTVSPVGGAVTFRGQAFRNGGTSVSVEDSARAINRFYGGGAGFRLGITPGRFYANVTGKLAVGANRQTLNLTGLTTLGGTGANATANGGLLVPATSNGQFTHTEFSYMPEIGAKVGFQFTQNFGIYVGYNFLYFTGVIRPGDNFTNTVNPTQLPSSQNFGVPFGPNAAPVRLQNSDFWIHSVGVGLNVRF